MWKRRRAYENRYFAAGAGHPCQYGRGGIGAAQIGKAEPVAMTEERIMAAEAQIQAAMVDIEKAKKDLSDVQTIKNSLGLKENG